MLELTKREDELLRHIQRWHKENNNDPTVDRKWLERRMHLSTSSISDIKKRLIEKGLLRNNRAIFGLTSEANNYLSSVVSSSANIVAPTYLPLVGQVKAGRTKQDELRVDMVDLREATPTDTIPIPAIHENISAFILEVVGFSMEHEGIYEGDYVIVQPYAESHFPKQRELIIARYLPAANEPEITDLPTIDDYLLVGPTIKYFTERAGTERPYRLSWRRDIDRSEYTIETKHIDPVGRVVGIYRNLM